MKKTKQLRRSNNRLFFGVLGGFAEFFGWNANLLRGIYVGLIIVTSAPMWHLPLPRFTLGMGVALYIVAALIMPRPVSKNPSPFEAFRQFRGEGQPTTGNPSGRKEIHAIEIDEKDDK
ncbi:PspC domain-containing protein [Periweissella cryptocerci]|uniref:PspC domain-containing protein n=1 Tax=Periweissella cryptocerci TaxID=2506420 RepID=A0A4V1AIL2_9LACO|nr:PspC domain-containing protein [Periweissella cryptocerci]QBO35895.1 PspC domain-containing protein [Periweissella cryptocerci]